MKLLRFDTVVDGLIAYVARMHEPRRANHRLVSHAIHIFRDIFSFFFSLFGE